MPRFSARPGRTRRTGSVQSDGAVCRTLEPILESSVEVLECELVLVEGR